MSNNYIQLKVRVHSKQPLIAKFWWKNSQGKEIWANIKYERLSYFCYGYEKLGHTTSVCKEEVMMSETMEDHSMYDPWLVGTRPWKKTFAQTRGGRDKCENQKQHPKRPWFDIMRNV